MKETHNNDIVERLRFWSKTRNDNPTAWNLDCGDAANEIEQLRKERDEARREADELRKETWDHGGAFGQYERDGK